MIKEKIHRLSENFYKGELSAIFTLCVKNRIALFTEPDIVNVFIDILREITLKRNCIIPVYCFMPDHQHLIIKGTGDHCDIRQAIIHYKQRTGFWMRVNKVNDYLTQAKACGYKNCNTAIICAFFIEEIECVK
ncbi:MAG: transposase [Nitrospirae bacterium]|nr:transposase [Nitrospirota bacterium]